MFGRAQALPGPTVATPLFGTSSSLGSPTSTYIIDRGVRCFWIGELTFWWPNHKVSIPTQARRSGDMLSQDIFVICIHS